MFEAKRKVAYDEVLPLPKLDEVTDRVRRNRVLLIVSPDSKIPPEEVRKFFEGISQKNNICVLSGDKTAMGSVEKSARQFFAASKADHRIPKGHPQRDELERKQASYDMEFTSTVLNLFDKVFFPRQRAGKDAELAHKSLDMTRDTRLPFDGEEQILKTLTSDPIKLFTDIDTNFDSIIDKAQDLLWPDGLDEVRWSDAEDRAREQAAMYWLPPRGLEALKAKAVAQARWEDLGNGYVSKKPKKKKTSIQVIPEGEQHEDGTYRLRINPVNAGPKPEIYFAEDSQVSQQSQKLKEYSITTRAVKVQFLVVDPTNQHETGDVYEWKNNLKIRTNLTVENGKRKVELFVVPRGTIKFSTDGTEPRNGSTYQSAVEIGDAATSVWTFAEADGVEYKQQFNFPAKGKSGFVIDDTKPAKLQAKVGQKKIDSTAKTFAALKTSTEKKIQFEVINLTIGQGNKVGNLNLGEILVDGAFIESIITSLQSKFSPDSPVTMSFKKAHFNSGHDLKDFTQKIGIDLLEGEVEQ